MEDLQNAEAKIPWYKFKATRHDGKVLAFWQFLAATIIILGAILMLADSFISDSNMSASDNGATAVADANADTSSNDQNCNVQGIDLRGEVVDYLPPGDFNDNNNLIVDESASENIISMIREAEEDDKIKAILLEIDSYGGSPTAGEEIATALKNSRKPSVAIIRSAADSAAYWAATGAGRIFAAKNSDVGSIGVTMSYLDASKQNQQAGLTYNQLSSGKFKDTGNPDKPLSADEIRLLMRDINIMNQNFIQAVSDNRKIGLDKVKSLADGSSMLGDMALKNGLIDQIGGRDEVKQYLKDKIGAEPEICW